VIDAWLRAEILLKGTVIYERLVGDYGFTANYQRVKMYLVPDGGAPRTDASPLRPATSSRTRPRQPASASH